ncbi:MAG: carboxypeptidase regulatory-like domain-containing protein, partial [Pseudomonadota bacterium]
MLISVFALLLASSAILAQTEAEMTQRPAATLPAQLTVLVFEQGRPQADLTVRAGERSGLTDANGSWVAELPAGATRFTLFDAATPLTALSLNLNSGEIAQIIITLTGPERRAMVSIESSHTVEGGLPSIADVQPSEVEGSGILSGRVVSSEDGQPIVGARLFVSGTPVEARTDEEGNYQVEIPAGEYSVSVLHSEFATRTIDQVPVGVDQQTQRDFELPPAGLELAEFVVVEPFIEGSLTSVIEEQRQTASVANVLGAEQISRAGDSDVGGALSRVTGLTLVDGQFIYIRGLGERYSSTLVNGSNVPSPDPTRKVVPLDLFPTGVIRSILVQKGYSPNMPGDFGGGVVEIRTRGIPDEDFFTIDFS